MIYFLNLVSIHLNFFTTANVICNDIYRVSQKEDGISDVLHNTILMYAGFSFGWKTSYGLMSIKTSLGNISLKNSDIFQSVLD